jgi:hypothetical protein
VNLRRLSAHVRNVLLVAVVASGCARPEPDSKPAPIESGAGVAIATAAPSSFDPLAFARARGKRLDNREATVPAQCYTKTEGKHNPCWVCHTERHGLNTLGDVNLQSEYAFSPTATKNHWTNLFVDRSAMIAAISDEAALEWVRTDNYRSLKSALEHRRDFRGYRPDLDFERGFDERGFARDGSGWRALRYKPLPGSFWPSNGSTDDVFIRLPAKFGQAGGRPSVEVYAANLAVLEASFASPPDVAPADVNWPTEPLDELQAGADLDGDGALENHVQRLGGLPERYLGDARDVVVRRAIYPKGTEFLHSVRYLDPDAPSRMAARMKELRYSRKAAEPETAEILRAYEREADEKAEGALPMFSGSAESGLYNDFGWVLQGYIEDDAGRLRLQTYEEHFACMGCHSAAGVTLDQTFAFPRKVPGADGFRVQDLRGIVDAPQLGHQRPETLVYFERAGGGDEFRANIELAERFLTDGRIKTRELEAEVATGDRDLASLLFPSRERALLLNKAYMALVREQRFELGRDAFPVTAANVHAEISDSATGLEAAKRVHTDGALRLDWTLAEGLTRSTTRAWLTSERAHAVRLRPASAMLP